MSENGSDRELVLGNRQLLAIFFVAALLCGVFFAVGYVVGGNSAKNENANVSDPSAGQTSEGKREEPEATPSTVETASMVSGAVAPTGSEAGALPAAEPRMMDNPASAGSAPPAPTIPVAATPAPAIVTKSAPPVAAADVGVSVPEKGASYLQIAAQRRPAADNLAKSLRDRGWPTILAQSSKPELVQVLVGPYRAPLAAADAKRKLTELGFGGIIVHKQ